MSSPLIDSFNAVAERAPQRTALVEGDRSLIFSELRGQVQAYSDYLRNRGIEKGDAVLVYVPMGIPLYVILLALWHRGATAVFVDAWTSRNRLRQVAESIECKAFIGVPKAHLLRLSSPAVRRIPVKIWQWRWNSPPMNGREIAPVKCDEADTALVTFTTGSTGRPKGAKRTHGNLLSQARVLQRHFQLSPQDIDLATLPIFVLNNLAQGVTSVLGAFNPVSPESADPKVLTRLADKHHVSCTAGSLVIYEKWARHCREKGGPSSPLEKIFLGGAPVFPSLARELVTAFPDTRIEIVYGSTEAEPISSILADDLIAWENDVLTAGLPIGRPVPEIEVAIVQMTDDCLPELSEDTFAARCQAPGEVGEICVRGDHVLREYFHNPAAEARTKIHVGPSIWHRTGDAGYLDECGSLFLLGRVNSRIIIDHDWVISIAIRKRSQPTAGSPERHACRGQQPTFGGCRV